MEDLIEQCAGYEIVCPDGLVRRYPYHNEDDAVMDARYIAKRGCWRMGGAFKDPNPLESSQPRCEKVGPHIVRPITAPTFRISRGQS